MKYVIFRGDGIPTPHLFPDHESHNVAARGREEEVLSAGFVSLTPEVRTYGASESLGVAARPSDAVLIRALLASSRLREEERFQVVGRGE